MFNSSPDGLYAELLQPKLYADVVDQPPVVVQDATQLNAINVVVQLWAQRNSDMPSEFGRQFHLTRVIKQPALFVSSEVERMSRSLKAITEPLVDEAIDRRSWGTKDLFALDIPTPMIFPENPCERETRLQGQEDKQECSACAGKGKQLCSACDGQRRVRCHECYGKGKMPCSRCNGEGAHLNVSGKSINCAMCSATGTVSCTACHGQKKVDCRKCSGNGTLSCAPCLGRGQRKRAWILVTKTETIFQLSSRMADPWRFDLEKAARDAAVLDTIQYPWPESSLVDVACPTLPPVARDMIRTSLMGQFAHAASGGTNSKVSGLRVRLAATYIFAVDITFKESLGRIYLGGNHNLVLMCDLPVQRRTLLRSLAAKVARGLSSELPPERPKLSQEFVAHAIDGYAHVLDVHLLIPMLAEDTDWQYSVTKHGYRVEIASVGPATLRRSVSFHVELRCGPNGQMLIGATCVLGKAYRDRYVDLLEVNRRVSFGRIAIAAVNGAEDERLFGVDWRPYDTLSPSGYQQILSTMAIEFSRVLASGLTS